MCLIKSRPNGAQKPPRGAKFRPISTNCIDFYGHKTAEKKRQMADFYRFYPQTAIPTLTTVWCNHNQQCQQTTMTIMSEQQQKNAHTVTVNYGRALGPVRNVYFLNL